MNTPNTELTKQSFISVALSKQVFIRAIKVAIIVGTTLAFINHGEKIITMSITPKGLFQIILTYFVPYLVSTWSAVKAIEAKANP
ncbi:nitrate/nitrite transporter NrtS [Aliikangiella sp. IMCC44359]|uniref:nitrate/nitrite transporter NrtS n=1 Tax=Aliikangiella sp. IMCC44359 TaxID=3459125 RepID=UPI00403A9624